MRPDIYCNELEIKIGKTQTIIPMQKRSCPCGFIFKLINGEIVVGGAMSGIDWPADEVCQNLSWRRSRDKGQTWMKTPAWPTYAPYQFPDGEIMEMSGRWWQIETSSEQIYNTYSTALFRSTDNGYIFKKMQALIIGVPRLANVKYQYSDKERYANINHQIVELHDGSLLASVQGKFENDIKERSFVIQSYDRGQTWEYLSTIAFDLTKGDQIRPLGFDEPNLLVLPDKEILCFMRSGSKRGNPLYVSHSKDDGRTWSHAEPITDRGVYPTACLMKNGIIAVVYGRPHDWITFSLDYGNTWIDHLCFNRTPEPYDCGNYDWLEEIAPNTLLVIYSQTDPNDNMNSKIMGTYIMVKPKRGKFIKLA